MSGTPVIPIITAPVLLPLVAAGVVVAGAGALCYGIGKTITSGCKDVYRMCKEGNYPVERLQMVYTPISNFSGLTDMLSAQGFTMSSISELAMHHGSPLHNDMQHEMCHYNKKDLNIQSADHVKAQTFNTAKTDSISTISRDMTMIKTENIFVASNLKGDKIFLINSESGIGLIGERVDMLQGKVQDFSIQEISSVLKDIDFTVKVEEKGKGKIITAVNSQKEEVHVSIERGAESAHFDTRRTRRPKCDIIHQLIRDKLGEKTPHRSVPDIKKRRECREEIKIRRDS